jgi:hypothetical protein
MRVVTRSREPQMLATTCEQPTTCRAVAFTPDGRRLHVKQSLRLELCRASLGVFAEFRMDRKVPDTTERKRDRKASAGRLRCRPRWRRSAKGIRAESRSMRSKGPAPNIEVEVQSPNSTRWELHLWRSESHSHVAWSERRSES